MGIASPTAEATPTPFSPTLNITAWQHELINDPDCHFILDGIKFGFKIIEPPDIDGNIEMNNYKSTREHATLVEAEIQKEIMEGRYIVTPGKPKIVSALGAIPKSDGAIRLIHDASRPSGSAVNDYSAAMPKQRFQSLQDVINLVTPNCFFAKLDLKAAYRSVGIHPSNYSYMGLKWLFEGDTQPTYLIDNRLCFGAKNSPGIFHRLTQAVRRMMKKRGWNIVCFLDDILLIADDYAQCYQGYTELIRLVRALGFAIAWSKTSDPCQVVTYLGLCFDSTSMTVSLPADKVAKFAAVLHEFCSRTRASKRQLQRLAGKLAYAVHVVNTTGRTYLQRVLDLLRPLQKPSHKVKLDLSFYQDVHWWLHYLQGDCCRNLIESRPELHIFTDACDTGGGMVSPFDWAYIHWELDMPHTASEHINVKETMTAIMAIYRWASHLANSQVIIHTDNITTKATFNKGASRNPRIMDHLRNIHALAQLFNFNITARYLKGDENVIADSISRMISPAHAQYIYSLASLSSPRSSIAFMHHCHPHMSHQTLWYMLQMHSWDPP